MKYEIIVSPKADKFIQNLKDKKLQNRIAKKLDKLQTNPEPADAIKLEGSDYLRVRVGDYRIIYEVEGTKLYVYVFTIGHRSNVYKKLL